VIDWIALSHWPIFNVADSAIVIAAIIAVLLTLRNVGPISTKNEGEEGPSGA
jgi:signal peptidase II